MSPLEGLLLTFVSATPSRWDAFNTISGIQWRDGAPVKNDDASDAQSAYYRRGTLMLAGFGLVDVPDGGQGADQGTKQANEGNAGITLNGDANKVYSIAVQKFYASEDYRRILANQLTPSDTVSVVADQCQLDFGTTSTNTLGNQFFLLNLSAGKVYVEAYADDGAESHGPGATTFIFYQTKPMQRIAAMQCKES